MERRRTERLFLRIPVAVQGVDQNGKPFTEETRTIEVNRDGARIGLRQTPRLGAEVRVTNRLTQFTALFRVAIQCPQSYDGLPEWGVALSTPLTSLMTDFWGVAFEELREDAPQHASALLVCRTCGRQEMVSLARAEYEVFREKLLLPRVCTHCHAATDWEPAEPQDPRGTAARPGPGIFEERPTVVAEPGKEQRRGARRVAVRVPLLVRTAEGDSEQTTSRDVSKTGLSFASALDVEAGDRIDIVVGYGLADSPATQRARVVWRRPEKKGVKALIGAQFTGVVERGAPERPEATEVESEAAPQE